MKKIVLFVFLFVAAVSTVVAQRAQMSPQSLLKLQQERDGKNTESISATVHFAAGADLKALDAYGVRINTLVGNKATVTIEPKQFEAFAISGLCTYIDVSRQMYPMLDNARAELGVDYIHNGINLPQGYDGSGVVVGVIDIGLFYSHPSFYDSTGSELRIKRVWQQRDTTGTPPAGFSYGTELTTPEAMMAAVTDMVEEGHGSHVTGIAAGCGAPDAYGRRYCGIAPGADIVLVPTTMTDAEIVDGVRYIHQYARSVHKPCVINMSLGSLSGPHDGLSPTDVILSEYLEGVDSLVIVVSAANNGDMNCHLHHAFSETDTVMRTYLTFRRDQYSTVYADCWGGVGDSFSLSVALHDDNDEEYAIVGETPFVSLAVDSGYTFQLVSPRDTVYECHIAVSADNPLNHRPEMIVFISGPSHIPYEDVFSLTIKSETADVNLWSDMIEFASKGDPLYSTGDDEYTIGGFAANSDAVISVGSYSTRLRKMEANGEMFVLKDYVEGDLSYFSSRGPTWDGRVKPDICAPGQFIASVYSTPYMPYYVSYLLFDSTSWQGVPYYYCLMQGTSMASPVMTGTVALWLQHNPSLNVEGVRALLHNSGRTDQFTGPIPATGSNLWGWGKLDAFAGVDSVTAPMHYVDVNENDFRRGFANGRGRFFDGPHTISATACNGYAFSAWSDGNTDNPRVVDITSDTAFVAIFETIPCDTISVFPWEATFVDGELNCWDNSGWQILTPNEITSVSFVFADSWLVTPHILVAPNTALYYGCVGVSGDSLDVLALTSSGDTILLDDGYYTSSPDLLEVELGTYRGEVVRLAFHHHSSDASTIRLLSARIEYLQGIGQVENDGLTCRQEGLRLTVENPNGATVRLFDIMGRQIHTFTQSRVHTFTLPAAGVYLIQADGHPAHRIVAVK